jgi:hypothetical protein
MEAEGQMQVGTCKSRKILQCLSWEMGTHRLFKSTSAFLHTRLEYLRPTPLMRVSAYMILSRPSTLVLSKRRINWKLLFSPETSAGSVS